MSEMLENWAAAGMIAGAAYADEMKKLATLRMIDLALEQKDLDEKTAAGFKDLAGKILKSPATKAIGIGGAVALGAGGGMMLGKKREHEKDEAELQSIAPQVFRAGFVQGARAGFGRAQQMASQAVVEE